MNVDLNFDNTIEPFSNIPKIKKYQRNQLAPHSGSNSWLNKAKKILNESLKVERSVLVARLVELFESDANSFELFYDAYNQDPFQITLEKSLA